MTCIYDNSKKNIDTHVYTPEHPKSIRAVNRKEKASLLVPLCVAVCCNVLQYVAVCCSVPHKKSFSSLTPMCYRMVQCVAACCRGLHGVELCCRVLRVSQCEGIAKEYPNSLTLKRTIDMKVNPPNCERNRTEHIITFAINNVRNHIDMPVRIFPKPRQFVLNLWHQRLRLWVLKCPLQGLLLRCVFLPALESIVLLHIYRANSMKVHNISGNKILDTILISISITTYVSNIFAHTSTISGRQCSALLPNDMSEVIRDVMHEMWV